MSEIEWSPWIQHVGGDCPVGGMMKVSVEFFDGQIISNNIAQSWHWIDFEGRSAQIARYRIPMEDYRRIYGDQLDSHPNSELDADQYTVGSDTLAVALDACAKRGLNPYDAAGFLDSALHHMRDREATYDAPGGERSMGRTVAAFNSVTGHELTEEQGWLFMVLLKAVRTQQGGFRADNYEDGAAYFGLQGEAAHRERS